MALTNINPNNCILIVNGRRLTEWGTSDSPITITSVDPKREMVACQNGDAVVTERVVQMKNITVNLKQHSADSAYMSAIFNSAGGQVSVSYTTMDTGESFVSSEGIITNIGDSDRGGSTASDDSYEMVFNDNVHTRGSI
tara:strand:+ start:170 stop:586 length:417 start_codon:yes stop_codon:yes gene_type:complete